MDRVLLSADRQYALLRHAGESLAEIFVVVFAHLTTKKTIAREKGNGRPQLQEGVWTNKDDTQFYERAMRPLPFS